MVYVILTVTSVCPGIPVAWNYSDKTAINSQNSFASSALGEGGAAGADPRRVLSLCLPSPASQVSTEASGEDRAPSEGDAMEVCSEHAEAHPEPPRERRVYGHRSVPGPFLNQVLNLCFWRILGLTLSVPTERSHAGLECWLLGEMKSLTAHCPRVTWGAGSTASSDRGLGGDGKTQEATAQVATCHLSFYC